MIAFDELFNKAKDVANAAGKKTGELVEISKLKLQEVQYHSDLQKAYEKLGSMVYEMMKNDCEDTSMINTCVDEIDYISEKLDEVSEKINGLRNVVTCTVCGGINPAEAVFCSKCGMKLTREEPAPEEPAPEEETYEPCETCDSETAEPAAETETQEKESSAE